MSTRKGTKGKKETHFMCMVFSQHTCFCTACLPANNTKWQEGGVRLPGIRAIMGCWELG